MSIWRAKALELFPDMRSQIESADQVGYFWVELSARFRDIYAVQNDSESAKSRTFIRATCLYAIWCTRSESVAVQQAALIEMYEEVPRFALRCNSSVRKKIVGDLVKYLGIEEIEKQFPTIGALMNSDEKKKFLADVRQAELGLAKRSRKR